MNVQSHPLPAERSCVMMPPSAVETNNEIAPEPPPTITEDGRLAADPAESSAGACADGEDEERRPSDVAALTGDNGGGTSGNHGNGTAG